MAGMLLIRFLKSGLEAVTGTSYCMKHDCIKTSYHLLMNQSTRNFTLLLLLLCLLSSRMIHILTLLGFIVLGFAIYGVAWLCSC